MTITKPTHKAFLFKLFSVNGQPKSFSLDKLITASSAAKKLLNGTEVVKATKAGDSDQIRFVDSKDEEFTAEEWVLLKELFNEKKTGTIEESLVIEELRGIFK